MDSDTLIRFLSTAFFAVVFLQSAVDKLTDRNGNLDYFTEHFRQSPLAPMIPSLLWGLTALELIAGAMCAFGLLMFDFTAPGFRIAGIGVALSAVALLALILGQRLAKDYAGAAVVAAYFAVALLGLGAF